MTNSMTTRSPVRSVRRGSLHRSRKRAILPFMATPLSPLIAVLAQYRQDAPERARGQSAVDQDHPRPCNIGSGALPLARRQGILMVHGPVGRARDRLRGFAHLEPPAGLRS